jgi:hypothetical protein
MDEHTKKIQEQLAVEGFLDAHIVISRDPLDFQDKDGDRVDDRAA